MSTTAEGDIILLVLVQDRRISHKYALSMQGLQARPEYVERIEDCLAAWLAREPRRRLFAQFRGMTHIIGAHVSTTPGRDLVASATQAEGHAQ
jgi:hypothetical protein